jgi:hypothetical protein
VVDERLLAVDGVGDAARDLEAQLLVQPPRRVGGEHEVVLHGVEAEGAGARQ